MVITWAKTKTNAPSKAATVKCNLSVRIEKITVVKVNAATIAGILTKVIPIILFLLNILLTIYKGKTFLEQCFGNYGDRWNPRVFDWQKTKMLWKSSSE
jgi:hypothetical protein